MIRPRFFTLAMFHIYPIGDSETGLDALFTETLQRIHKCEICGYDVLDTSEMRLRRPVHSLRTDAGAA